MTNKIVFVGGIAKVAQQAKDIKDLCYTLEIKGMQELMQFASEQKATTIEGLIQALADVLNHKD